MHKMHSFFVAVGFFWYTEKKGLLQSMRALLDRKAYV